jgi:uncharacterized membrane protein
MYIPIFVGCISFLQQFRPYFRKHISDKLEHHEYLFLNSLLISIVSSLYLVFLFVYEKTTIETIFKKYRSLTLVEILFLLALSGLTVISGILIYEMDKNKNTPFLNSIYMKFATAIALISVSIFMYKESYKIHQFAGFALIIFGFLLSSSK